MQQPDVSPALISKVNRDRVWNDRRTTRATVRVIASRWLRGLAGRRRGGGRLLFGTSAETFASPRSGRPSLRRLSSWRNPAAGRRALPRHGRRAALSEDSGASTGGCSAPLKGSRESGGSVLSVSDSLGAGAFCRVTAANAGKRRPAKGAGARERGASVLLGGLRVL